MTATILDQPATRTQINDAARSVSDTADAIARKSAQLFALLVTARGDGAASFRGYSSEIQEHFLDACTDMAEEIRDLAQQ